MSIDPNPDAPAVEPRRVSAIENEIPAYRAVSPPAVVALILGVLSILCFASLYFLAFAALAVVIGFVADRKIQLRPEELTGRGMAQAAVGLGLIFGLTSVSIATVQGVIRSREATAYARKFEDVLKNKTFEEAVWNEEAPAGRDSITPEKLVAEIIKNEKAAPMADAKFAPIRAIKKALEAPGADLHFRGLQSHGEEGLNLFAAAVYELHSPRAVPPAPTESYAQAILKAAPGKKGGYDWWVETLTYPYTPTDAAYVPQPKPVDDGHGHAH